MSTYFVWEGTKAEFVAEAKRLGWKDGKDSNGDWCLVSPSGHYCHDISEYETSEGPRVGFTKYGGNADVWELANDLGALSEHDEGYDELAEPGMFDDED